MQEKLFNRYFILIWFGALCLLLIHNTMCAAIPLYLEALGFSTSFSGLLGIPFAILGILSRILGGCLMDRFSRRLAMIVGILLMGMASLFFGLFPSAILMILFRGLHGAGFSLGQTAFSTANVDVTPKDKGSLGIGIFWISTALSLACTGYIIQSLSHDGDYGHVFLFCFFVGLLGIVLSFFCTYEKKYSGGQCAAPGEKGRGMRLFFEPAAFKPAVIEFFVMLGVACCNIFILTFAASQGYNHASAFLLIAAITMAVSNLTADKLIRCFGARNVLGFTMAISGMLIALIALVPCEATYCLGGIGFGMSQGFSFPVLTVLTVEGVPHNRLGTANSTMLMTGDIGMGIGTFLWGAVIDSAGYLTAYTLSGFCILLSGLITFFFYMKKQSVRI